MMCSEDLIKEIQKGLLQWYDFKPGSRVLYIGKETDGLAEALAEHALKITCVVIGQTCDVKWLQRHNAKFDYIVAVEELERHPTPKQILEAWQGLLKRNGKLLLGLNNRFGIRYFCGDRDPYTERNFDGIEGYRSDSCFPKDAFRGRMYGQAEIGKMLRDALWHSFQFFSVFPDLRNPCLIYAEDYLPNEDLANRVFPTYNYPDTVFLEEEALYADLIENGMFHKMANAYLIECAIDGELSDVSHVTSSVERGREYALFTVIHKSGIVEKRAVYPEGRKRLEKLIEHGRNLDQRGIAVVDAKLEEGVYVMPFIKAEVGQIYLKRLLQTDLEKFLEEMDRFRNLILQSSEIVEPDRGDGEGAILRRGYLDMVPLNSFHVNGTFVFFDQEFCEEYYPANAIITRMITAFYYGNAELYKILPATALFARYNLTERLAKWQKMEWEFLAELLKEKELGIYRRTVRRNMRVVNSNRQRINYSEEEYQRLFVDIFSKTDTGKLVLFGSGMYAKKFLGLYRQDYPVYAIVDNNADKWAQEIEGIPIQSPEILGNLKNGEFKVIICAKDYFSITKQLDAMGIEEYSIYDPNKNYPEKRKTEGLPPVSF